MKRLFFVLLLLGALSPLRGAEAVTTQHACAGGNNGCATNATYITVNIFNASNYQIQFTALMAHWCATLQGGKCGVTVPQQPTLFYGGLSGTPLQVVQGSCNTDTSFNVELIACGTTPSTLGPSSVASLQNGGSLPPGGSVVLTYNAAAALANGTNQTMTATDGYLTFMAVPVNAPLSPPLMPLVGVYLTSSEGAKNGGTSAIACFDATPSGYQGPWLASGYGCSNNNNSFTAAYSFVTLNSSGTVSGVSNFGAILRATEALIPAFHIIFVDNLPLTSAAQGQQTIPIGGGAGSQTSTPNTWFNNWNATSAFDRGQ